MEELISVIAGNTLLMEFSIFILIKNELLASWLNRFAFQKRVSVFQRQKRMVIIGSVLYWCAVFFTLIFIRDAVHLIFNIFSFAFGLYVCSYFFYLIFIRKKCFKKNFVVNKKRILSYILLTAFIISVQIMRMDYWILQPYISSIPTVEYVPDSISYNESDGIYSITTNKRKFKILQLTDIHLGGSLMSASKDYKALNTIYGLIRYAKPDLVIVTGDLVFPLGIFSYSFNNTAPIIQFTDFMRNIGIPWAFTYGNHDTENIAKGTAEDIENIFKTASYKTSKTLLYPYIQPDITGRNNQLIELKNADGSLRQGIFLLDSNAYTGEGINDYDYIHDDQVAWYTERIETLKRTYGDKVSSLMFFHMPLQEYKTAYKLYENNRPQVKYYFGINGETMIEKVCSSRYHSKIFNAALQEKSTKALFCGHDHYNNTSLEYQGIRLTYGMSIDYLAMPGIEKDTEQRGATLITLSEDSSFNIQQLKWEDIADS